MNMKNTLTASTAVSMFCGLLLIAGRQSAFPAQQPDELAQQAFDLLDKRCGQCHGETGSNKDLMLISRNGWNKLVGKRSETDAAKRLLVDTEKPEASLLYLRITGKHPAGMMPPSYAANPAPLTSAEQAVILKWERAGAPDWKNVRQAHPQRRFISNADLIQSINRDLAKLDPDRQKDTRYFTLTHLYNAGVSETEIAAYRDGLKRLLNSLSWEGEIIVPASIDPEQTIFRINLKRYGWKASTWQKILQAYPYNIHLSDQSFDTACRITDCDMPFVRADWFVTHAGLPPLYHDILELPSGKDADVKLEQLVLDRRGTRDANQDIEESPGDRVWRSGFRKSGVSANNRVVEWHTSLYGYYWKSYDFADVTGFQNIKVHPLDFKRAGGEIIFGLPNGLQGYMLVSKDGSRLDVAPSNIVSNDRSTTKDKNIYNGLSCMGCHTQGMIDGFDLDEVRNAVVQFPEGETRRQGLKLYADRAVMQSLLNDGKKRFREALAKLNSVAGTNEPMVALAEKFQGDVDPELASAELGVSQTKLQEIIKSLNDPVLNDLRDGKIARKSWEEQISLVVGNMGGARYVAAGEAPLIAPTSVKVNTGKAAAPVAGVHGRRLTGLARPLNAKDGDTWVNPKDGAVMVYIPAGSFLMGDDDQAFNPRHTVTLSAYWIYRDLVTVAMYKRYCKEKNLHLPEEPQQGGSHFNPGWSKEDHPIVDVSWNEAVAYCAWAGATLPSEAQWEKAARGTDGLKYPWGDTFDLSKVWVSKAAIGDSGGTTPVGVYGVSPYGCTDMAGNVWQWCADWFDGGFGNSRQIELPDPVNEGVGDRQLRATRGSSWLFHDPNFCRTSFRNIHYSVFRPDAGNNNIGFRCAAGH